MDHLRAYIQTILAVLLLAVVVDLMAPRATENYVRLVVGLVMVLAVLGPLADALGQDPQHMIQRWQLEAVTADPAAPAGFSTGPLWELALSQNLRVLAQRTLEEMDPESSWQVEVEIRGEMQEGQMNLREVHLLIEADEGPGSISVGPGPVQDPDEQLAPLESRLRSSLARAAGLDPGDVHITWRKGR